MGGITFFVLFFVLLQIIDFGFEELFYIFLQTSYKYSPKVSVGQLNK